jgi:hypothetical protein
MDKILDISQAINEQNLSHIYDTILRVLYILQHVFKDRNTQYYSEIH